MKCLNKRKVSAKALATSLLMFAFWLLPHQASGQAATVSGTVTDNRGAPIVGGTVLVKDTTTGTVTDAEGRFELKASPSSQIEVSMLGYLSQTIPVGNRTVFEVQLQEKINELDDVVVVGYGTQIRRNIVGAVETISGSVVENRPNAYLLRSIQGQIPGVNITMVDGKPSRSATINIRGNTQSIGAGGSALCLIDGVEGDLTAMNPEDVESITILKDASSAAVYGARGAFGVVLVTTKKAKEGRISVNYSGAFSIYQPTVRPTYETDGMVWYDNFKTSYVEAKHALPGGINNFFPWSQSWEDEYKKRYNDPDQSYDTWRVNNSGQYEYFGNTDWYDEMYRKTTYGQQHNVSVSGGSDKASFAVSARHYMQEGIYRVGDEKFRQSNFRAKGSVKIAKWLTLDNNTDFVYRNYHQPMGYNTSLTIPRLLEHQGFPVTNITNPDGTWTAAAVATGYAGMADKTTYRDNFKYDMTNRTALTGSFLDNQLVAMADFTILYNHSTRTDVVNPTDYKTGPNTTVMYPASSYMDKRDYENKYYSANATLSYTPKLGDNHSLTAMGGWNIENKQYRAIQMKRDGLLNPNKPNFSLMDGTDLTLVDTGSYDWGFVGVFYRLSYAFKGKYLFEASGRYDASSKFPASQQWGFFPSFSVGWRISDENFLKDVRWISNLKLRLSGGSAGNGNVAPYQYMELMTINKSSSVLTNGTKESYTSNPNIIPRGLTWEKVTTYDIGLDFDALGGRLNFTGDIYQKNTTDMYVVGAEIPAVAGYSAPKGNNADMRTRGFEVSLAWQDGFMLGGKRFNYNVRASFWDSQSVITKYTAKNNILPTLYSNSYYEGMTLGEMWGYHVDGLFATDEEAQAWGKTAQVNTFWSGDSQSWGAGDIRFADLDESGEVNNGNNTLENHGDLKKIGNSSPRYHYGINFGANWNNIGFSIFFQGIGRRDWYPAGESAFFWGQYNRPYSWSMPWHNTDRWTEENQDVNAYWPRMRSYLSSSGRGTLRAANDRYLQNARYCRLKNVTLDYTITSPKLKKAAIQSIRVYVSGENLFFWSPLKKYAKNFDPEQITAGDSDFGATSGTDGQGYGYPQTKSYSIGLNITF